MEKLGNKRWMSRIRGFEDLGDKGLVAGRHAISDDLAPVNLQGIKVLVQMKAFLACWLVTRIE